MNHYKSQLLACDFLTVETLFLRTLYIFFFIEIGTRRIHIAGITEYPNSYWVAQQARNFGWLLQERDTNFVCLIRDNDSKYTDSFDTVFESEGINIICTPFKAPNANTFAERWVRTLRTECLDNLLIINETHLRRVLTDYVEYYNSRRPHQGLNTTTPAGHIKAWSSRHPSRIRNQQSRARLIADRTWVALSRIIIEPLVALLARPN
jgi:hypothetical protein